MPTGQLWLFPPPKPLVERFGEEFFRQLPARPAVYLFCGPAEGVLYVGEARNLRRRLAAYRVANPERLPRRMVRLLHQVTRIEFDLCASGEAASPARHSSSPCWHRSSIALAKSGPQPPRVRALAAEQRANRRQGSVRGADSRRRFGIAQNGCSLFNPRHAERKQRNLLWRPGPHTFPAGATASIVKFFQQHARTDP